MQDDDRQHQMDDRSVQRPEGSDSRDQQAPVIRLLANPRRIRRA
jgi:hypothetical protein